MIERVGNGGAYGYLAHVDGTPAGWVNASPEGSRRSNSVSTTRSCAAL